MRPRGPSSPIASILLFLAVLAGAACSSGPPSAAPDLSAADLAVVQGSRDLAFADLAVAVDLAVAEDLSVAEDLARPPDLTRAPDLTKPGVAEGQPCGQSDNGRECAGALACCYPCGIPGCAWRCEQPCNGPGCVNGCFLRP